ncbi:DeoR family transcriptional regulator [Agromyces intestinalis]|uniref:DeoR family transcriptional regulator n=2 Tax=Agromyces intestinalis TaxID=2592652 RepID=A0A5C1YEF6_9MICO|nr:substrate-binding domain-containing protein [Agromyces intestinalis]QEO13397.1 DeoR family transcriptional regulator [Agromyces intestinalis]
MTSFGIERRERILAEVRRRGAVRVAELAVELGVSELTVRRDIGVLADRALVTRVHGGAVLRSELDTTVPRGAASVTPSRYRIAMVVPSLSYYWPQVTLGARSAAAELGVQLVLRGASYSIEDQRRQIVSLLERTQVHGLIVAPDTEGPEGYALLEWLGRLPLPVVLTERRVPSGLSFLELDCVRTDHSVGASLAARHLAARGHVRVGLMTSRRSPTSRHLRQGWRATVADLGMENVVDLELEESVGFAEAFVGIDALLEEVRSRVCTGMLIHADPHALLVQQRALELGWHLPEDLAIVAYDDEVADSGHPPITALAPPKQEVGRLAVETLVARLEQSRRPVLRVELIPDIRLRESSLA